jgi:hypothetical protein
MQLQYELNSLRLRSLYKIGRHSHKAQCAVFETCIRWTVNESALQVVTLTSKQVYTRKIVHQQDRKGLPHLTKASKLAS